MEDPDETSYEQVTMEETLPVGSGYQVLRTSTPEEDTPIRPRGDSSSKVYSRIRRGDLNEHAETTPLHLSTPRHVSTQASVEEEFSPIKVSNTPKASVPEKEEYDTMLTLTGLSPVAGAADHKPKSDQQNYAPTRNARLTGLLPVADQSKSSESVPTIVNNYSNCSFESSSKNSGRKTHKVPAYDDTKLDIEAYLANFEAMTLEWTQDEKLALLRAKLTGKAAKILAALDLRGLPVTFDILVAELECHYVGERSEWVAKLRDVRREDGETLDDLAFRISLYSKRAYGCLQKDLGLQLYLALRDGPLGDKLFEVKDQPLTDVLKRAKSYETHLLALNQPTIGTSQNVASTYPPAPVQGSTSSGNTQGQFQGPMGTRGRGGGTRGRGQQRYGSQDRRVDANARRCFICKSPDHMWRECPRGTAHFTGSTPPVGTEGELNQ
jgi:hypothetical protein